MQAPLGWGQNIFSEVSHVAYQIRREWSIEYHASTYVVPTHTPTSSTAGSKGQNSTFSEHGHVAYQIKWISQCSINMQAHILSLHIPSTLGLGQSKGQTFCVKVVILHVKLEGNGE